MFCSIRKKDKSKSSKNDRLDAITDGCQALASFLYVRCYCNNHCDRLAAYLHEENDSDTH